MSVSDSGPELSLSDVRIAKSAEERERIFRCRYDIFVDLWGRKPPAGDHKRRAIEDTLDEAASLLYVEKNDEVVATMRLNFLHRTALSDRHREIFGLNRFFNRFPPESLTMSSQLFVAKKWRDSEVVAQLLGFAYTLGRESETQFDFRLCTPSLSSFFELLGYRRYIDDVHEADGARRVPLVCVMEDVEGFRKVDSPFYHLARRYENSAEAPGWFTDEIEHKKAVEGRKGTLEEDELHLLGGGMDQSTVPLFKGLSEAEVKRFVDAGKVTAFGKGETIVKAGYLGNEMFVVLKGHVEVRGNQNGVKVVLGTFGVGEVFGEISFLMQRRRTADVVGLTDGKVLEVSQAFLEEAMIKLPTLTNRVLLNLSVVLCERLCSTTVRLLLANQPTGASH